MLDVFNSSAFDTVSLTAAINRMPYKPGRIGEMRLFATKGITTPTAVVEEKDGVLSLIPTSARGTVPNAAAAGSRTLRDFRVPHLTLTDGVMADEVIGIRAFGTEDATAPIAQIVNDKIFAMKQSFEVTQEYHRLGAIKGVIYDSDGTTVIYNLFTEFESIQPAPVVGGFAEFDFTAATPAVKVTCLNIIRMIEANLGGAPYDHIHCFCDSTFFDGLTGEAGVVAAYAAQTAEIARALIADTRRRFYYGGVVFEEYPGTVGTVPFIEAGQAYFFPVGCPGLFVTSWSPADYVEAVGTVGKEFYAKQERMAMDRGISIECQSNPLSLCTRPMALIRARFV